GETACDSARLARRLRRLVERRHDPAVVAQPDPLDVGHTGATQSGNADANREVTVGGCHANDSLRSRFNRRDGYRSIWKVDRESNFDKAAERRQKVSRGASAPG